MSTYPEDLFSGLNDTKTPYSSEILITDLLEQQASDADAPAIWSHNKNISYKELFSQARLIATHLGHRPSSCIALLTARTEEMIIGMLGILLSGAAYVPIDPDYPPERQAYILKQSGAMLVLAGASVNLPDFEVKSLRIGDLLASNAAHNYQRPDIDSSALAYTIFTSGSTGKPKGVMIPHHAVVNLIQWVNKTFQISGQDRLLFITSMCFDLSVYDIFGTLAAGATIVIADEEEIRNVARLAEIMLHQRITFWDSVPTTLDFLVRYLEENEHTYRQYELRTVFLSGDWIPMNLPDRIRKFFPNAVVISLGGATEATVWSNFFVIGEIQSSWKSIPYGKPIANNYFYTLDAAQQPVSHGQIGELYIGGVGVATGYANDAEKTAAAFFADPFAQEPGARMYKTGDLGRLMPDGNIEFLGRSDTQVKIRGFRVELSEIETVALQHPMVRQVVVAAKEKYGVKFLAGYVVGQGALNAEDLSAHLRQHLPDYMVPVHWKFLDALPLNGNNKIDRNALPEPDEEVNSREYHAPGTEQEKILAPVWQKVLQVDKISIDDNFFDLGGQSLLAMQLLGETGKQFGRKLSINTLFKYPTIRQYASYLSQSNADKSVAFKSLVELRKGTDKIPLYIVHGDGFNFLNFSQLAASLSPSQPVYAIQPLGMDGTGRSFDNMDEIARYYVSEIVRHDPSGPYALAGYSFGGFVAIEMKRLLEQAGKKVPFLGIFDTNAGNISNSQSWYRKLPVKIARQAPKLLFVTRSLIAHPLATLRYQSDFLGRRLGLKADMVSQQTGGNEVIKKIDEQHLKAFRNYRLTEFNGKVHLFKASQRLYYVDDFKFLGWRRYAHDGVTVHDVPGDHKTMFESPNVASFGNSLQQALDSINSSNNAYQNS